MAPTDRVNFHLGIRVRARIWTKTCATGANHARRSMHLETPCSRCPDTSTPSQKSGASGNFAVHVSGAGADLRTRFRATLPSDMGANPKKPPDRCQSECPAPTACILCPNPRLNCSEKICASEIRQLRLEISDFRLGIFQFDVVPRASRESPTQKSKPQMSRPPSKTRFPTLLRSSWVFPGSPAAQRTRRYDSIRSTFPMLFSGWGKASWLFCRDGAKRPTQTCPS